ncbi:tumor necrosis factor receptor superfamily member 5 isoform X1 [Sparus aurata]|uniref:Tumor necrosis factor receptor superfamily member 5-like n=2 Tax=Sparus aurata TaxID=8175 RepID=A0A671WK80_SPAAU|nr:tumor necrosis factor receptor superfamily member 5-like isoform X1 [Sparus aurata]
MGVNSCSNLEFTGKNRQCCNRCKAGTYMKAECDGSKATECAECEDRQYTATINHLKTCQACKLCSPSNYQKYVKECKKDEDAVCECVDGYYCLYPDCEHCQQARQCPEGEGVKVRAAGMNNTICAPCEGGTYSNVTDSFSVCKQHTRCENIGRVEKTPGTSTTDAICGDLIGCNWILPAGLWSGLVLTAIILFVFICWREKRKSYRPASPMVPVTLVEMVPAAPASPLDLPLPTTELKSYCQESCTVDGCDLPLIKQDDNLVTDSPQDSVDSYSPITPFKVSVSFTEPNHRNGNAVHCNSFFRTHSEPQEDEWCGDIIK